MGEAYRVTKIICPSCKGTGRWSLFAGRVGKANCLWCKGSKRISSDDAAGYAEHVYTIAVGGYVCGDHDWSDRERMEAEALAVYALIQRVPSWGKAA